MNEIYLTHDGYERLRKELEYMKTVKRRELSKAIGDARAHGDISENAEYDAAKDEQAMNEKKIAVLEDKLSGARIIEHEGLPDDMVLIGAKVKIKDLTSGKELTYTVLSELEADYSQDKISITSPVGRGLLGHKENEIVEIKVPEGTLKYKILKISR